MPILRNVDVHKAMYSLGFPCNNGYVVEKIKAGNRNIDVTGHYYGEPRSFVSFKAENSPFESEIRKDWTFSLKVPIEHIDSGNFIDLNAILPDSKNKFEIYPGFVNDYLILDDNSRLNYLEINMLVKEIVNSIIM